MLLARQQRRYFDFPISSTQPLTNSTTTRGAMTPLFKGWLLLSLPSDLQIWLKPPCRRVSYTPSTHGRRANWYRRQDLNLQQFGYHPKALPLSYCGKIWLRKRESNPLSKGYEPSRSPRLSAINGTGSRIRTYGLLLPRQKLYQTELYPYKLFKIGGW